MEWVKRIIITVVILIIIGIGGFFLYQIAYASGEEKGYESGYPEGEKSGYSLGKQDGYEDGYDSGKQDGYDSGYEDGYVSGEEEGFDEGYTSGRDDGYAEGYDKGKEYILEHSDTLRDPTYDEVIEFLKEDKTDENPYIEGDYGVYVCTHFAKDVNNNAEEKGLRCAFVAIRYPEAGHSIIGFNTTDQGFVYFDAQSDERVRPIIGKPYYQCIEPKPGYYYEKPPYDDTIMDILIIW